MNRLPVFIIVLAAFLASCGGKNETITRSFYYWKSTFSLGTDGNKILKELQVKKIYLKFFDVDVRYDEVLPKSTIAVLDSVPSSIQIVPVIFITNSTLTWAAGEYEVADIATKIVRKIKGINNCFTAVNDFAEIQFDCDWTEETKDKYFYLLQQVKEKYGQPVKLTATIRLHQVKYFERTGVPPVSRGTLMFYNMGKIDDMNGDNSIYNEKSASAYLQNFDKYPLPLDVALPVYSWAIAFHEGKITGILNDIDDDLKKNEALKLVKENLYEITKVFRYNDMLLWPGDHLKFEEVNPENAVEAAKLIRPYLAKDSISVTLFDYDYKHLSKYETRSIEKIYSVFE